MGFLLTFFLKEPKKETAAENKKNSLALFKSGILLFKKNANFRRIVLLSLFTNPLIPYLFILYPPYFLKAHVPQIMFGLALSVGSIFTLIGNKYAYLFEKKLGVCKGIFVATILPAILYFSLAFFYQPVLSFILFCLIYLPSGLQDPLFTDYQNRHIESENRATVISLVSMLNNVYIACVGLLIGFLADKSLNIAFIGIGIIILTSSFIFRINEKHVMVL